MNKITILLLITLVGFSACKSAKLRKKTADELAIGLHEGVLLVRLQTAERKANTLRQLEKPEEAEKVLAEQKVFNQKVRTAFETHYDFSPVYFFYAPNSRLVREGKFSEVLHDFQKQDLTADNIVDQSFLVAEFTEVKAPATNAGLDALVLMDDQFKQISMPFPYAVPTHIFGKETLADKAVLSLNQKLQDFYAKAVFRERKRECCDAHRGLR